MRLIDVDALIENLLYDVELDEKILNDMDFVGNSRELVQFDKDCKQNIIDLLRDAPPIESERKKGKWIYYDPNGFKCSECGGYLEIGGGDVKMNFCPNCGADMR